LIDTGCVKSFINEKVHASLDFNNSRSVHVDGARFISITGDPLHIKCSVECNVKFPNSKCQYLGNFLVSSNISYECVLGWDFLVANRLEMILNRDVIGEQIYSVQGPHGKSSVLPQIPSMGTVLSGVVQGSSLQASKVSHVLSESRIRGTVPVTLLDNILVPPRSEIIIEGRIGRTAESELGLISPLIGTGRDNIGMHVAYTVSQANSRSVPVRLANVSEEEVELTAGSKIAELLILVELPASCNPINSRETKPFTCGSVDSSKLAEEIEAAIDPSLSRHEKEKLRKVLLEFSDVFEETLGHTTVVNHKIDTGDSYPIKQRHVTRLRPERTISIMRWKVELAPFSPNGIRQNWKRPAWVVNAVFGLSAGSIGTCQYPLRRSKVENIFAPFSESKMSSGLGRGLAWQCVTELILLKSIQNRS